MNVQFVRHFTSYPERINMFHHEMFHGITHRLSPGNNLSTSHNHGEDLSDPIFYTCNGYKFPEFANPTGTYIISQNVMELIKELPGLQFGNVIPKKIIYLPYEAGDFSYFERSDFKSNPYKFRYDKIFELWPDRPELRPTCFPRFEIVFAYAYRMAKERYWDAKEIDVPDPTENQGPQKVFFSEKMLEENSILGDTKGALFSQSALSKIQPYINMDYFEILDIKI